MNDLKQISKVAEKAVNKAENILTWFELPKEDARNFLIEAIKQNEDLNPQQASALIYKSRKLVKEYANSKTIYEQAKAHFENKTKEYDIDNDWLHFFFDKAEKVSNKSMQHIWASLLAGEYNQPGSISRKLMHIISIMDVHSARSFQTFCLYIFERSGLITAYDTEAALIPTGFHENEFDFMKQVETWLKQANYSNYRDLAIDLTLNTGELNSLENLGLVQKVSKATCGIPLCYRLKKDEVIYIIPKTNNEIPLGVYDLTEEGKQLYHIINIIGEPSALDIVINYLNSLNIGFEVR